MTEKVLRKGLSLLYKLKKDTPPLLNDITLLFFKSVNRIYARLCGFNKPYPTGQLKLLSRLKPRLNDIDAAKAFPAGKH